MSVEYVRYPSQSAGSGTITDINGAIGPSITITAGAGISVGTVGNTITVSATGSSFLTVDGTRAAPQLISAAGGIAFTATTPMIKKYIAGNGSAVIVTANPQIAAGLSDGQELTLQSRSATNTVELQNGNGLSMNGPWIGGLDSSITFTWDLVNWVEKCRQ